MKKVLLIGGIALLLLTACGGKDVVDPIKPKEKEEEKQQESKRGDFECTKTFEGEGVQTYYFYLTDGEVSRDDLKAVYDDKEKGQSDCAQLKEAMQGKDEYKDAIVTCSDGTILVEKENNSTIIGKTKEEAITFLETYGYTCK